MTAEFSNQPGPVTANTEADPFRDALASLKANADQRESERMTRARELYGAWAEIFELLKSNFQAAADVAGTVTESVPNWSAHSTSYGQWGVVGASGYGYNFGLKLEYHERIGDSYVNKSVIMQMGCDFPNGIGDERSCGLDSEKLSDTLLGFDGLIKQGVTSERMLRGAEYMLDELRDHKLAITIARNNQFKSFLIESSRVKEFLEKYPLGESMKKLFLALNSDEFGTAQNYIENLVIPKQDPRLLALSKE